MKGYLKGSFLHFTCIGKEKSKTKVTVLPLFCTMVPLFCTLVLLKVSFLKVLSPTSLAPWPRTRGAEYEVFRNCFFFLPIFHLLAIIAVDHQQHLALVPALSFWRLFLIDSQVFNCHLVVKGRAHIFCHIPHFHGRMAGNISNIRRQNQTFISKL